MSKFNKDELFCSKCLTHDTFFKGYGSWIADNCPQCGGTDCIMYKDLTFWQKIGVRKKFDKMWKIKWKGGRAV